MHLCLAFPKRDCRFELKLHRTRIPQPVHFLSQRRLDMMLFASNHNYLATLNAGVDPGASPKWLTFFFTHSYSIPIIDGIYEAWTMKLTKTARIGIQTSKQLLLSGDFDPQTTTEFQYFAKLKFSHFRQFILIRTLM